ncbi:MAG TPA: hypothetical protein V6C97_01905 [Oculatellaceae cyanobacterium]
MKSANRKTQKTKATESPTSGASNHFKFIVTGFNSFGKNLENPSGLTARNLPSEMVIGSHKVEIDGHLLETCCTSAWKAVNTALNKAARSAQRKSSSKNGKHYTVLLMLGLAAVRSTLNLERLALNLRDYPIKDNHGHKYDGEEIMPGQLAVTTDYPLPELRKRLNSKGFPAHISNHCGTFVCNDVYYQSLNYRLEHGTPDLILFVHVPPARVFAQTVREVGNGKQQVSSRPTKAKQLEIMQAAIVEVIKFTVEHLSASSSPRADAQRLLTRLAKSGSGISTDLHTVRTSTNGNGNGHSSNGRIKNLSVQNGNRLTSSATKTTRRTSAFAGTKRRSAKP